MKYMYTIIMALAVILHLVGCNKDEDYSTEVKYIGLLNEDNLDRSIVIDPAKYGAYEGLLTDMKMIACSGGIPTLALDYYEEEVHIGVSVHCADDVDLGCYFFWSGVLFRDEKSVFHDAYTGGQTISEAIEEQITTSESFSDNDDTDTKLWVVIEYDKLSIIGLEDFLLEIITHYDGANRLGDLIVEFGRMPPPPPPPPPLVICDGA